MMQYKLNDVSFSNIENLQTLVENRTVYTLERCELNVFETYEQSYKVPLTFNINLTINLVLFEIITKNHI